VGVGGGHGDGFGAPLRPALSRAVLEIAGEAGLIRRPRASRAAQLDDAEVVQVVRSARVAAFQVERQRRGAGREAVRTLELHPGAVGHVRERDDWSHEVDPAVVRCTVNLSCAWVAISRTHRSSGTSRWCSRAETRSGLFHRPCGLWSSGQTPLAASVEATTTGPGGPHPASSRSKSLEKMVCARHGRRRRAAPAHTASRRHAGQVDMRLLSGRVGQALRLEAPGARPGVLQWAGRPSAAP
jgi:hypothetical protein